MRGQAAASSFASGLGSGAPSYCRASGITGSTGRLPAAPGTPAAFAAASDAPARQSGVAAGRSFRCRAVDRVHRPAGREAAEGQVRPLRELGAQQASCEVRAGVRLVPRASCGPWSCGGGCPVLSRAGGPPGCIHPCVGAGVEATSKVTDSASFRASVRAAAGGVGADHDVAGAGARVADRGDHQVAWGGGQLGVQYLRVHGGLLPARDPFEPAGGGAAG